MKRIKSFFWLMLYSLSIYLAMEEVIAHNHLIAFWDMVCAGIFLFYFEKEIQSN